MQLTEFKSVRVVRYRERERGMNHKLIARLDKVIQFKMKIKMISVKLNIEINLK